MKKALCIFISIVMVTSLMMPAFADKLTDAKRQKRTVDKKISDLAKQKKTEEKKLKSAKEVKEELESAQKKENKEYQGLLTKLNEINDGIIDLDEAIAASEQEYNDKMEILKVRLRIMYENSDFTYIDTLAESKNVVDFLERLELVSTISKKDKEIIDGIKEVKTDIEYKKQEATNEKEKFQEIANQSLKTINNLSASRANVDEEIRDINSRLDKLEDEEDKLLSQSNALVNQIKNLQRKGSYAGGSMTWPCPSSSRVSSYYGNRLHPILKKYKMHTGIDISANQGVSIVAANKGTVIMAGWQSGYGNTVVIDHGGGITTLYAHCSKLLVSVGETVKAGETIAKVGSTGMSTGPHLHFEVRKNGSTTDPLRYVSK
ncbi:murein hydrolase activator EnvC family protein [Acetivibrio cellulolyticus]|uniref:murein hydrolase activator EnvC family protein n=1 Tax=Acetivibrio cellulolyticus TaxID=35830 RepID=UPI0001E2D963|nr:peptidoglycan DD-metalloendopeptidase family protein [Acetivibrio cellulolyticus]